MTDRPEPWEPGSGPATSGKRHAPATQRNRDAILAILREALPPVGLVLEVASGSGEHARYFAAALPTLEWQPSDPDPDRYRRFGETALAQGLPPSPPEPAKHWRALQRRGKYLSVIRLAKASFTYASGIDYLAWKINRHAGTAIQIKPWQRRWPLIGALTLLPRLFRGGAIR